MGGGGGGQQWVLVHADIRSVVDVEQSHTSHDPDVSHLL